ncbi:LOW QUALITY PROTEIN: hypothetical protein Cgig2_014466 [Carnegiea gigantea]|uniref:Uncharacterized protein n=1 Tax=Carnegiea gigantea TaxID=171969 RepID=A0A9Q1K826_9CARY|nr:LOW QUALITY PROTEIN: hypothetical protein Cgig2_014466 [Carnegiea gigantea]
MVIKSKSSATFVIGDVAPRPEVSPEVKRDMNKLRQEFKEKNQDKVRRTTDFEEEIPRSINRIDVDDDDTKFYNNTNSIMTNRASSGRFYDEGDSSQAPTVWEGGSKGKRVMTFTPLSTHAKRLKAVEIDLEKDRTRTKQSKVNASWMKTTKKKLIKAFRRWVVDNNQPFTVVDSTYTNPLLDTICEVGPDVRASTSYELTEIYLPEACAHNNGFGGDLTPLSSGDGSGNRGTNDIGTFQSSRPSSTDVSPTMSDHNGRRGEKYEEVTIAHAYRCLRKAKDKETKAPFNFGQPGRA